MPGGWSMSMAWMNMPGQTRIGAAVSFLAMWMLMMLAMMLPSLVPMLLSYRRCVHGSNDSRLGTLTAIAASGYFFVWAVFGAVAYGLGVSLTAGAMRWSALARSVPVGAAVLLLVAGGIQLTPWKARQLGRCRLAPACVGLRSERARNAWQHGVRLGVRCSLCCAGFMTALLVVGVMNLGAMALIAAALTIERVAPRPATVARVAGVMILAAGALALAQALKMG